MTSAYYSMAASYMRLCISNSCKRLFGEERGDAGVITAIVLVAVAVLLGIIFRKAIVKLASNLWESLVQPATEGEGGTPSTVDNPFGDVTT